MEPRKKQNSAPSVPKRVAILEIPNLKNKYAQFVKIMVSNKLDGTKPRFLWIYKNLFTKFTSKIAFKVLKSQEFSCICHKLRPPSQDQTYEQAVSRALQKGVHYQCKESCRRKIFKHQLLDSYPTYGIQRQELANFVLVRVLKHQQHVYALQTIHNYSAGSVLMEMKGQYVTHEQAELITHLVKQPVLVRTGKEDNLVSALYLDQRANLAKFILYNSKLANVRLIRVQVFHSPKGFLRVAVVAIRDIMAGELLCTADSLSYD